MPLALRKPFVGSRGQRTAANGRISTAAWTRKRYGNALPCPHVWSATSMTTRKAVGKRDSSARNATTELLGFIAAMRWASSGSLGDALAR